MPIISMVTRSTKFRWRTIGAVIVLLVNGLAGSSYASESAGVEIRIDAKTSLTLTTKGHGPFAELVASKRTAVAMGPGTRSALAHASEFFVVGERSISRSGRTFFLLITQTPSPGNNRTGYCGSGTEDVLRLLELVDRGTRLVENDKLQLQSCLDTLSLSDDTGRTLRRQYEHADPESLGFTWLEHPKFGNVARSLIIEDGSLSLK